jgi:hypothetical protein
MVLVQMQALVSKPSAVSKRVLSKKSLMRVYRNGGH